MGKFLEAMSIALDEEVGVRGAEGGIKDEIVAKAVKCIADIIIGCLFLTGLQRPRIYDGQA